MQTLMCVWSASEWTGIIITIICNWTFRNRLESVVGDYWIGWKKFYFYFILETVKVFFFSNHCSVSNFKVIMTENLWFGNGNSVTITQIGEKKILFIGRQNEKINFQFKRFLSICRKNVWILLRNNYWFHRIDQTKNISLIILRQ